VLSNKIFFTILHTDRYNFKQSKYCYLNTNTRTRVYDWTDPIELFKKASTISGSEFLNGIINGELSLPPIAKTLDFHPVEFDNEKIIFEFQPQEFHYNPIGSIHGGVISTVLDTVMGCAVHAHLPKGKGYTTLEVKVNFTKPVSLRSGRITAEGKLIHLGKSTALVESHLKDDEGKLYAYGTSTYMLLEL